MSRRLLGSIRITAQMVDGEAPQWVRRAWHGLILGCLPVAGCSEGEETGVRSGQPRKEKRYGFSVPQDRALRVLARHKPRAAEWWREHGFPHRGLCFKFDWQEAEIIRGVKHQNITEVKDDDFGDPYR